MDSLEWLVPWEFSPTLVASFLVAIVLFVRGQRVHHVTRARQILFWTGMVLLYLSLHTRLDYYAERMFFIHRIQHLVLHHLGPLLVMAAFPGQVMRAGLPMRWRLRLRDFLRTGTGRATVAVLTHKIFVPALFVFLVLIWLIPSVQFYSMLDWRLYRLMNWSVVISGFVYWNLILDRRPAPPRPCRRADGSFRPWRPCCRKWWRAPSSLSRKATSIRSLSYAGGRSPCRRKPIRRSAG